MKGSAGLASPACGRPPLVLCRAALQPLARFLLEPRSRARMMWLHSTYHGTAAAAGSLNRQAKQGDRPGHVCMGKFRREKERKESKENGAVNQMVRRKEALAMRVQ